MDKEQTSEIEQKFKELLMLEDKLEDPKLRLVLLIHTSNLQAGLECTGLLEDDKVEQYVLPPNWKKDIDGIYSFRYADPVTKDDEYFIKIITEDDVVEVNGVSKKNSDNITSIEFKISENKDLDQQKIDKFFAKFRADFLIKLVPRLKSDNTTKKEQKGTILQEPGHSVLQVPRNNNPQQNPLGDYGRNDLDPFGGNNPFGPNQGGGNVVGPNNPVFKGGLQQGGPKYPNQGGKIRFDPYGPEEVDPNIPDNDIFFPQMPNKKDPFGGGNGGGFGGFGGGGFGGGGNFGGGGFI